MAKGHGKPKTHACSTSGRLGALLVGLDRHQARRHAGEAGNAVEAEHASVHGDLCGVVVELERTRTWSM